MSDFKSVLDKIPHFQVAYRYECREPVLVITTQSVLTDELIYGLRDVGGFFMKFVSPSLSFLPVTGHARLLDLKAIVFFDPTNEMREYATKLSNALAVDNPSKRDHFSTIIRQAGQPIAALSILLSSPIKEPEKVVELTWMQDLLYRLHLRRERQMTNPFIKVIPFPD